RRSKWYSDTRVLRGLTNWGEGSEEEAIKTMRHMNFTQCFARWGCALLLAVGGLGWQSAEAIVTTAGDVFPTDNPFTAGYEGIVNYIPNFVYGPDDDPDLPPPQPNFEHPLPIIVGQT